MKPRIYKPSEIDFETNGLGILTDCTRCEVYEVSNGKYELELDYPLGTRFDEYFENDYQIKAKPNDQEDYHIFCINDKDVDTFLDTITIYAQSRTNRLGRRGVTKAVVEACTAQEAMDIIENNMDRKSDIRLYSDITTISSTIFEARNVLNCVAGEEGSLLQFWGGEIKRDPFKLSLLKRRGRDNVGTIRYGKDLAGLKVQLDWKGMKTSIIPYADIQNAEGTSERIYGSPVDSQYINNYPDVYTDYVQFTEDQGVKDVASLNKIASKYFTAINPGCDKPKISIIVEFTKLTDSEEAKEFAKIRTYGLFDTFKIYHSKYNLYFETKVSGVEYDTLSEKTTRLEAGDTQVAFYQQQSNDIREKLKEYATNSYMSDFNDYVSSMITGQGSAGGHVVLWPKEKPSNIFIMDNADINKAKEVLRMNKNGIAFSKSGWNGPFNSAWTIDSVFNANFIKAGKIQADVFEASFNNYGDILRLVGGALQIWNNRTKIMELTKTGMEFWNGAKSLGSFGTKGGRLGGLALSDTNDYLKVALDNGEAILLMTKQPNSTTGAYGIAIQKNGNITIVGKEISLMASDSMSIYAPKLDLSGTVTINGQTPGTGGNDGDIPSDLTTEQEKNAWAVWQFLKSKGYTEQAAAGILGNMQGESGIMPDVEEVGGPGYGLVQWTSPYASESGRAYVQRLLREAGISGDYRNIATQLQLLDWHMHNGQYIASAAYPYSVAQFKALTDIATATAAFEKNFERPAATHPERIDYAKYWYNKLHGLKPSNNTWRNPVRSSYVVTQEWDEIGYGTGVIHGGIDLASMPAGSMPNIYGARSGTVQTVTFDGTGGNYVVVKHSDSYWTYYGHLDSVNVAVGDKISTDSVIGIMGATGLASGVHLHFEVWKNKEWGRINPRDVINF